MSKKCGCSNTVVMPCNPCAGGYGFGAQGYGFGAQGYGANNIIWLILLLGLSGNNGCNDGCNDGCNNGCNNNVLLLLLLLGGFNGQGCC